MGSAQDPGTRGAIHGLPTVHVITLGVQDLRRAVRFYTAGMDLEARSTRSGVVYCDLNVSLRLALYDWDDLARYAGLPAESPKDSGFGGMTLSCNLNDASAVDARLSRVVQAGARVLKVGYSTAWGGYEAWFADPDGYPWELVYNPAGLP